MLDVKFWLLVLGQTVGIVVFIYREFATKREMLSMEAQLNKTIMNDHQMVLDKIEDLSKKMSERLADVNATLKQTSDLWLKLLELKGKKE